MSEEDENGGPVVIDPQKPKSLIGRFVSGVWDDWKPLLGAALCLLALWYLRYRVMPEWTPAIGWDGEGDILHALSAAVGMLIVTLGAWVSASFNHRLFSDREETDWFALLKQSWHVGAAFVLSRECLILAFWGFLWFRACFAD